MVVTWAVLPCSVTADQPSYQQVPPAEVCCTSRQGYSPSSSLSAGRCRNCEVQLWFGNLCPLLCLHVFCPGGPGMLCCGSRVGTPGWRTSRSQFNSAAGREASPGKLPRVPSSREVSRLFLEQPQRYSAQEHTALDRAVPSELR